MTKAGSGGGGGGGGGGSALIKATEFSTNNVFAVAVQNTLRWVKTALAQIDPECGAWLNGNSSTIDILLGESSGSTQVYAGTAEFSESSVNAIAGVGGTDMAAGTALLTVNQNGAFFNASSSTGVGYAGGSDQAKAFIILHELAHLTNAKDFLDNDRAPNRQTHNNDLVMKNCGKTLARAGGSK